MHSVPLNRALIPACASAAALSFRHDELYVLLQPYQAEYPTRLREHFVRVLRRRLDTPGMVARVMLSDDCDEWWDERAGEKVLGWAVWRRNGRKEGWDEKIWGKDNWRKVFERFALHLEATYITTFHLDPSICPTNLATYHRALSSPVNPIADALSPYDNHMLLEFLAIHPTYQRRGVGTRLLSWGIERGDTEGIPIGVVGSLQGARLYERMGWKDVGYCIVDFEERRLEDRAMVRWPGGGNGNENGYGGKGKSGGME